jgi:hypothetical protein
VTPAAAWIPAVVCGGLLAIVASTGIACDRAALRRAGRRVISVKTSKREKQS